MPGRPGRGETYRATITVAGPRDEAAFTRFKDALADALQSVEGEIAREGKGATGKTARAAGGRAKRGGGAQRRSRAKTGGARAGRKPTRSKRRRS